MITTGSELRKKHPPQGEVTTPSGNSYLLRRPPLRAWGALGGLPAFFAVEIRRAWSDATSRDEPPSARELTLEEKEQRGKCYFELLRYAFIEPRLVEADPADDEITIPDLERAGDLGFLIKWVFEGARDVPVSSNPEGVQISDLRAFPDGGPGEPTLPPRENGTDLRGEAIGAPRG